MNTTPRPYSVDDHDFVDTKDEWSVGGYRDGSRGHSSYVQIDLPSHTGAIRVYGTNAELKAQLIVRAVNAYNALVAQNQAMQKALQRLMPWVVKGCAEGIYKDCVSPNGADKALKEALAALARGEATR